MCFSATSDFVAAAALAPVAVVALKSAPTRRDLPIAALPAIFALHQGVEGFVWLGSNGDIGPAAFQWSIFIYLLIAQVILPALVPIGIWMVEDHPVRRRFQVIPIVCGLIVAAWLGNMLVVSDLHAHARNGAMVYETNAHIGKLVIAAYLVATCGAVLLCSERYLVWYGFANVIGLAVASTLRYEAVLSIWCFYAALVSGLVLLHLRRRAAIETGRETGVHDGPLWFRPRPSAAAANARD
jgi:hypothetical protein